MTFKLSLSLLLLFISAQITAQELNLKLTQYPNKEAIIIATHGFRKDTLGTVLLDKNGSGTLYYKTKQAFAGLVNLTIKDTKDFRIDFVLSPTENPTLQSEIEYGYGPKVQILHSPENDYLSLVFTKIAQFKKKIALNEEMSKLYEPKIPFYSLLETEKRSVKNQLQTLADTTNNSPLFAAKLIQFKTALEEQLTQVWESNEQRSLAKKYFTQMDFDALYGSSMWVPMINSCKEAYTKESPYYGTFGSDVVSNLKRIKNQQVYDDFMEDMISLTEKLSWTSDQKIIIDFVAKDKRIQNPQSKIQHILDSFTLSIGKKAPDLLLINAATSKTANTILKTATLDSKYTLLFFYDSGCGHCEIAIEELKKQYPKLTAKGLKIIAFAADVDAEQFTEKTSNFPWANTTYCDLKGMSGPNFKNYEITITPTMFVLDNKGNIIQKPNTVEELMQWITQK